MSKQKRDAAAAEDMSAVQTQKCRRPEKPPGADWSSLPPPAIYLIMKSLLPASPADVFSAARVCRAWKSVFGVCRRDLLSSMTPIAVHSNLDAHPAITNEGRWSPPPGAARPWGKPDVIGASHGHLFVADADTDYRQRRLYLVEAVAALTGEETPVIALPSVLVYPQHLLMTAHPASPKCVVVAVVGQGILEYCRIGDQEWTAEYYCLEGITLHMEELYFTLCSSVVTVDGKVYGITDEGKLLIAESFFPQINISVLVIEGLPPEDPFPARFMLESGGDILCFMDDPDCDLEETADGVEAWMDGHLKFGVFRLDLPARRWVRADAAIGDGSRAFLLNYHGECLSWEAAGTGEEGRVFARGWGFYCNVVTVYHMKHGLVEQRQIDYASVFFLPCACYLPSIGGG